MSNRKFTELRLSGSAHGKRYAEEFPHGPRYRGLEPIQDLIATLGADEIVRIGTDVFMGKVLRKLQADPNVAKNPHPSKRRLPHTRPAYSWNIATSFYYQNPFNSQVAHLCFVVPNFMDFKKEDGTYSNQHVVLFSSTDHEHTNDLATGILVDAFLSAHADFWNDE